MENRGMVLYWRETVSEEVERLRVQLAGCLTAAEGHVSSPAKEGDYGWSPAYQAVLELRREYEKLRVKKGFIGQ